MEKYREPEVILNEIEDFCRRAATLAGHQLPAVEEVWRRVELTLHNMSRRILTPLEAMHE